MRRGQVMILTVLALGGTLLGVTTIAGLLMSYQLRQATDLGSSARAIFAANSGVECAYFEFYKNSPNCPAGGFVNSGTLSNGATFEIRCFDTAGAALGTCSDPTTQRIQSIGTAGKTVRILEAQL